MVPFAERSHAQRCMKSEACTELTESPPDYRRSVNTQPNSSDTSAGVRLAVRGRRSILRALRRLRMLDLKQLDQLRENRLLVEREHWLRIGRQAGLRGVAIDELV